MSHKATENSYHTPADITDAICRHKGHMILEAGAGTGKTYSLTRRVIYQLTEQQVPLERMLALTFTDFAAAEMRYRIYEVINERLKEEGEAGSDHLRNTRRRFSRNYISTFHSFCNRILQYFPDEITEISVSDRPVFRHGKERGEQTGKSFAGREQETPQQKNVEGTFELLSDYDEVLRMLEWRKRFYQMYKGHAGLQRQLSRFTVTDFESFMGKLSGVDDRALHHLAVLSPEQYVAMIRKSADVWQEESRLPAESILNEFAAHPEWFKPDKMVPETIEDLRDIKNKKTGFKKKIFNREEIDEETLSDIDKQGDELFGYLNPLRDLDAYLSRPGVMDELSDYPQQEEFDANHEAFWNMRDLAELSLRWNMLMRYQRFEAGFFNYDDMIWLTHKLFTENPDVVTQMRNRFDQILVDEFQDTDRRQWEIIRKLGFANDRGGHDPGNTKSAREDKQLLIVGDVKQAIYAFRGGDVAMMGRVHADLKARSRFTEKKDGDGQEKDQHDGHEQDQHAEAHAPEPDMQPLKILPLPYSFRSNRTVIHFSNQLFRHIHREKKDVASYEAHHQPLETPPGELSDNAEATGDVRVFITDCRKLKSEHKEQHDQLPSVEAESLVDYPVQLEARRIARFLREIFDGKHENHETIRQKMHRGDKAIGVLYRRRKHIYALEQALSEVGLPYTVARGTRYYQRREIRDAWLLLAFLLDAYDDLSLVGLLRSPMISLSDSGLLAARVAMDRPQHDYPNFWSAISNYESWASSLSGADRNALEAGVPLLNRLREMVPDRRVSEMVEQAFFTDGPYLGAWPGDLQVRENLVKLLDVIRNLESTGRGTLFEITEFLANRIGEEAGDTEAEQPDPASIQLMTIHGSKGLEFPMVVIPDMYAGDHDGGVQLFIADDDEDSFAWPAISCKPGDKEGEEEAQQSFLHQVLKSERSKRNLAETKRLFYVAVTRAETHLLLSLASNKHTRSKGSFAELFESWLKEQEPDAVRVDEMNADDLEALVEFGRETAKKSDTTHTQAAEQSRYRVLDRTSEPFLKAGKAVSSDIQTASGQSLWQTQRVTTGEDVPVTGDSPVPVSDAMNEAGEQSDEVSPWIAMSPADAGTLIHRTLETGFNPEHLSGSSLMTFWTRELIRMNIADPEYVASENKQELMRHVLNAQQWITRMFGEHGHKRFEVAFEVTGPFDVTGSSKVSGLFDATGSFEVTGPFDATGQETNVTIRGSIDMIIQNSEGVEHIVDFKTGPVGKPGETGSKALVEHARKYDYDRQIRIYQTAWQQLNRRELPPDRVWLLFTSPRGGQAVSLAEF